jgi:hypothetical protein
MKTNQLFDSLEAVVDESTFIRFVELLIADRYAANSCSSSIDGFQGEWANQSIEGFLEAASSWAEDSAFGERPGPKSNNPWQLFASFLWAGRGYE